MYAMQKRQLFYQKDGNFEGHTILRNLTKIDMQQQPKEDKGLFCARCTHLITSAHARINIDNRHLYTFTNPHGIVYEIGCFQDAPGCVPEGQPEIYWSWFPGYTWQIQRCSSCQGHLGWRFSKTDSAFFGLVLAFLIDNEM
jgi:hypothetical protein